MGPWMLRHVSKDMRYRHVSDITTASTSAYQHITSEATSFRVFDCRCGLHGQSQICVPDNTWLCGYTCRAFSCNLAIPASRELTIRPCIMMVISVWRAADKLQHIRVPSVRTERRYVTEVAPSTTTEVGSWRTTGVAPALRHTASTRPRLNTTHVWTFRHTVSLSGTSTMSS